MVGTSPSVCISPWRGLVFLHQSSWLQKPSLLVLLRHLLSWICGVGSGKLVTSTDSFSFSQVVGLDRGGDSLRSLIFWMNGPRLTWGRMPRLALTFFVLFKGIEITIGGIEDNKEDRIEDNKEGSGIILSSNLESVLWAFYNLCEAVIQLIRTSWMMSEKIVFSRQTRANENGTDDETFVNWTIIRRLKQKGKFVCRTLIHFQFRKDIPIGPTHNGISDFFFCLHHNGTGLLLNPSLHVPHPWPDHHRLCLQHHQG